MLLRRIDGILNYEIINNSKYKNWLIVTLRDEKLDQSRLKLYVEEIIDKQPDDDHNAVRILLCRQFTDYTSHVMPSFLIHHMNAL